METNSIHTDTIPGSFHSADGNGNIGKGERDTNNISGEGGGSFGVWGGGGLACGDVG